MGCHTSVLTYTMGIAEYEEKGKEKKNEEIMAENSQNVIKGKNLYIREVQQTPGRINAKILTPRHVILKFLEAKDKEKISKEARDLHLATYKRPLKRLTENFSSETVEVRKKRDDLFFDCTTRHAGSPLTRDQIHVPCIASLES